MATKQAKKGVEAKASSAKKAPVDNETVKQLEYDGYKFTVDFDLMDDVEAFEIIDRIENNNQVAAIVPLLHFLIGKDGYEKMKAYYVKKNGRFKFSTMLKVYEVIVENFDPKD